MVFYDEMYGLNANAKPLDHCEAYQQWSQTYSPAAMASKREIVLSFAASRLPRYNVLDMKAEAAMALGQCAVLTPITGPAPHQLPQSDFHSVPADLPDWGKMPLGYVLQDRNQVLRIHQSLVSVALILAEAAFVGTQRQGGDAVL